jgi:hypothetical protein
MDSDPGGQQNPLPPPYSDPSGQALGGTPPPYGGTPPPYGGTEPPYGATPPPYGGTPPPYAPPDQTAPFPGAGGAPPYGFPTPAPTRGRPDNKTLGIIGGGVAAVVLVIVLIVVLAGGGGSSPTSTVNSFISALLANNGTAVCALVVPAQQSSCTASQFTGITGHAQVVSQAVEGTEALVAVTGQYCVSGQCLSNSDPTTGMPGNGVSFDEAFTAATSSSNTNLSPAALEEVNGTWYLDSGSG